MFPDKRFWREGRRKASVARKWNEADEWGRNEALHPVFCKEVVVGKPGGRNGVVEGSAQWNESGYSCRGRTTRLMSAASGSSDRSR